MRPVYLIAKNLAPLFALALSWGWFANWQRIPDLLAMPVLMALMLVLIFAGDWVHSLWWRFIGEKKNRRAIEHMLNLSDDEEWWK